MIPRAMTLTAFDLLQAAPQPGPGGGLIQFLPMIFIFVIFYFLLIAPMRVQLSAAAAFANRTISRGGSPRRRA